MSDPVVHELMRRLVERIGKQSTAAAIIALKQGKSVDRADTADLSLKMNGHREWTIADMLALEEAARCRDVTDYLSLAADAAEPERPTCLREAIARSAKEHGESVSAALNLGPNPTVDDLARAEVEAREDVEAAEVKLLAIQDLMRKAVAARGNVTSLGRASA